MIRTRRTHADSVLERVDGPVIEVPSGRLVFADPQWGRFLAGQWVVEVPAGAMQAVASVLTCRPAVASEQ